MLAYNCRSGPLEFTNSAKLHLGYDGWYNKEKQVCVGVCLCVLECVCGGGALCVCLGRGTTEVYGRVKLRLAFCV